MIDRTGRPATARGEERDDGFSLVELIVAMGIFTIFIVLFLSAVIGLSRGTSQVKLTAESSSSALIVFQNFDRQVRYADAINFPGDGTGGRYIEFRTPAASSPTGVALCTQWRFVAADGLLETRQWNDVPSSVKSPWAAKITTAIATVGADYPFEMKPVTGTGASKQQLVLTIDAGDEALQGGASIETVFVARNSSLGSPSNVDVDGDKVSDDPVCDPAGYRP
jgi:prepilin-type N-terminal cleavage/methylation domain-containing protein